MTRKQFFARLMGFGAALVGAAKISPKRQAAALLDFSRIDTFYKINPNAGFYMGPPISGGNYLTVSLPSFQQGTSSSPTTSNPATLNT
jgi:hypothetical protein